MREREREMTILRTGNLRAEKEKAESRLNKKRLRTGVACVEVKEGRQMHLLLIKGHSRRQKERGIAGCRM